MNFVFLQTSKILIRHHSMGPKILRNYNWRSCRIVTPRPKTRNMLSRSTFLTSSSYTYIVWSVLVFRLYAKVCMTSYMYFVSIFYTEL